MIQNLYASGDAFQGLISFGSLEQLDGFDSHFQKREEINTDSSDKTTSSSSSKSTTAAAATTATTATHSSSTSETKTSSTAESTGSSESSDSTSSNCVVCSSIPDCPVCSDDEECAMTIQTCLECPITYCKNATSSLTSSSSSNSSNSGSTSSNSTSSSLTGSSSSSSSPASSSSSTTEDSSALASRTAKIGGITGAVAGVCFLAACIVGYLLYRKWYRKRYPNGYQEDKVDLLDKEEEGIDGDGNNNNNNNNDYERRQRRLSQGTLTTVANSVFTKASNVINVTYIPGVTTRVNNNNSSNNIRLQNSIGAFGGSNSTIKRSNASNKALSIFSKETYFSDLEDASLHQESINMAVKMGAPQLVSMDEKNYYDPEEIESPNLSSNPRYQLASKSGYVPGLQDDVIEEEDEDDIDQASRRKSKRQSKASAATDSSDDSDLADSDEENIEFLTTQHQLSQSEAPNSNPNSISLSHSQSKSTLRSQSSTLGGTADRSRAGSASVSIPMTSLSSNRSLSSPAIQPPSQRQQWNIPLEIVGDDDDEEADATTNAQNEHNTNTLGTNEFLLDVDLDLPEDFDENTGLSNPFSSPFD